MTTVKFIKEVLILHNIENRKTVLKRKTKSKKIIFAAALTAILFVVSITSVAAAGAGVYSGFFSSAKTVLQAVVCIIGAALALWGVVNLLEGYGSDNPGSKSQGLKLVGAGAGIILVGISLVPALFDYISSVM